MIELVDKSGCCGCSACANVCGHGAIVMKPDGLGFLYPAVDAAKCVDCGLCEKVCSFNDRYDKSYGMAEPDAYAVRHKEMKEIEKSRSGAVFAALSDWILDNGGVVYGAGYADHFRVVHKCASNKNERDEFRGSKYVQSDMNSVFPQVRRDLKEGVSVLFSGTPCQTSGLRSYLSLFHVDVSNLYLVDVVCHGVPAPYVWRDYLAYVERKRGMKSVAVNFRDKARFGWTAHKESFTFEDGTTSFFDTYTHLFYRHIMFRHSCGVCPFTNTARPSDITIADFWGWEKVDNHFNFDDQGVSLVLINSLKGCGLFDKIKEKVDYIQTEVANCLQPNLCAPSSVNPLRIDFEGDYIKYGFIYVAKRYGNMGWRYKARGLVSKGKNIIKRWTVR